MRSPGDHVRVVMTKWGARPHWEFDGTYLGADRHGDWVGFPLGTAMSRPGVSLLSEALQVGVVPGPDAGAGGAWLATFHGPGLRTATYVDIATPPVWDGAVISAVDLDLDVVRLTTGEVYVDDEDEFAEHRVALGYPDEVVTLAQRACAFVHDAVLNERAPFDGSADRWFAVLAELTC